MSTAHNQARRSWRISANVYLDQTEPHPGECERWETPLCGPHPCSITLALDPSGVWRATVDGLGGHSPDAWVALDMAQERAVRMLEYRSSVVAGLDFESADTRYKP